MELQQTQSWFQRKAPTMRIGFGLRSVALASIVLATWSLGLGLICPCSPIVQADEPVVATSQEASAADIPHILKQLDSAHFEERQLATQNLASLGSVSLRPLAKSFLESSPEKRWRIKRILEQLCVEGDEATFFKSAAILRTLYGAELTSELIVELQRDWKRKRTQIAADQLRELGADVELQLANEDELAPVFFEFSEPPDPVAEQANAKSKNSTVDPLPINPDELIATIDRIMIGSIDQNQRLALPEQFASQTLTTEQQLTRQFAPPQLIIQNGIVIQDGIQGRMLINGQLAFPDMAFFGSNVRIGKKWQGTAADLQSITAIQNMTNMIFEDQSLTVAMIEPLQRVPELRTLTINRCQIDPACLENLANLKQVVQLTLTDQPLTVDLANAIAALVELRNLNLQQVTWDAAAQEKLADHKLLQALNLNNMTLDSQFFEFVSRLVNLRQLQIQACKFDLKAYREFARKNPQLDINVTGRSFMGVRAPLNTLPVQFEQPQCAISEVVPGSGAEAAGLQAGDEIISINGEPIRAFEELVLIVSQFDPGKTIQVEYRRNKVVHKVDVVLGDRTQVQQE